MIYTKEKLDTYKHILKEDVYNKLLFFFDTPTTVKSYCMHGMEYLEQLVKPTHFCGHDFYYSSDEFPVYARLSQPCWGPLGGIKFNQKNLYIWFPSTTIILDVHNPQHPLYEFWSCVSEGMFNPGTTLDQQLKFIAYYGIMYTPSITDVWPSPVCVGFLRNISTLVNGSIFETVLSKLIVYDSYYKEIILPSGHNYGSSYVANWATVANVLNGRLNPHILKLKPMAVESDYSCWDSPLTNLFTDYDITKHGKYITRRATDINWDEWVERDTRPDGDKSFYGRNNGITLPENAGEVAKEIKKALGSKYKSMEFKQAQTIVSELILDKVKQYEKAA